ncbi:MAG: pantoate--beta-alanine ligase [Pseudomonadota bacterium]
MLIAHSVQKITGELDQTRYKAGVRRCVGLVTTRGDLHDGHAAVIHAARTVADIVVVAVIPTDRHGSDKVISASEFQDISFLEQHGADMAYLPSGDLLLGGSTEEAALRVAPTRPCPMLPDLEQFLGVQTRLINTIQPDILIWGEKKYLEFAWLQRLINTLQLRTQTQCVPTVRHASGMAVSANIQRLSQTEREIAPVLHETLRNIGHAISNGARSYHKLENTARLVLREAGFELRYCRVLDQDTMAPPTDETRCFRVVAQAKLNGVPLTDTIGLTI